MREIQAQAKSIKELLKDSHYAIDYYQREYKWEQKQIFELVDDLVGAFLEDYDEKHQQKDVQHYSRYFLGSIILSRRDEQIFVVDGQQRLSSLTLLLIYLRNQQQGREDQVNVDDLIRSVKFGEKRYNLNVPERIPVIEALFENLPYDETDKPESVSNLIARYRNIEDHFPFARPNATEEDGVAEEGDRSTLLSWKSLPFFIDWLTENVHLVVITAYSDDDAYTIFETMNDRGLSLTPTDMLKGYLLANIADEEKRNLANAKWKQRITELEEFEHEASSDFIKAWLRGQYATKIRERKKEAKAEEFDKIGTEFHRWVRDNDNRIGLNGIDSYHRFITRDLDFYARQYKRILQANHELTPSLERICYINSLGFTLHPMVLLAPLRPDDTDHTIVRKMQLVATYLDILLVWRQWNYRTISYSAMQYAMFNVMVTVRKETTPEGLAHRLRGMLKKESETFDSEQPLRLHQRNSWFIRNLLARITDYVEVQSENPSMFLALMDTKAKNRFEIEHIWADQFQDHSNEFSHPIEFADHRNLIGDLLLLPKSFNASYGKKPYSEKRPLYFSHNLLAQSLDPQTYGNNPRFLKFMEESELPFHAHEEFRKADILERQELYRQIATRIWNPDLLLEQVTA
jgi:hypothetical protein